MRVVFMGTPQFAVPTLLHIAQNSHHEIVGVVTNIDKPAGRGRTIQSSPVKQTAERLGIAALQPLSLQDRDFISEVGKLSPDIFVVVAFRILPDSLICIPKHGALNLHASLLPKYRGAAPIQWALINGEKTTGITIFQIDSGIDTGGIILQKSVDIAPDEDAGELSERLADIGAGMMVKALDLIESGNALPVMQDSSQATRAPKITPELFHIDWNKPAENIVNLIRGLSPDNAPYAFLHDIKLKFYRARIVSEIPEKDPPGTVIRADQEGGFLIKAGKGAVQILKVQREGKRVMSFHDFLRGNRVGIGERVR